MGLFDMKMIPFIDCVDLPPDVLDWLLKEHEYGCHYDHTVLQIEDDGNPLAEWMKSQGYLFVHKSGDFPSWDMVALYGS